MKIRLPFEVVIAGLLAVIGAAICTPVAALWVLLHDEPEFDETW